MMNYFSLWSTTNISEKLMTSCWMHFRRQERDGRGPAGGRRGWNADEGRRGGADGRLPAGAPVLGAAPGRPFLVRKRRAAVVVQPRPAARDPQDESGRCPVRQPRPHPLRATQSVPRKGSLPVSHRFVNHSSHLDYLLGMFNQKMKSSNIIEAMLSHFLILLHFCNCF